VKIYTIGVYGSTEQEFFNKLLENKIDAFCDIRRRRGVRGSEYSFVNKNRLQAKLAELEIKYGHILELAPTTEIREKQRAEDEKNKEQKKTRTHLGCVFVSEYKKQIIEKFYFDSFIDKLDKIGANRVVLFCVESNAKACHRALVAEELHKRYGYETVNL
jgi:uncharacterized protein (DUF488 family)